MGCNVISSDHSCYPQMRKISAGKTIGYMALGGGVMGGLEALNEYVVKPRSTLWGTIMDSFTLNFNPYFKGFFVKVPLGKKPKTTQASRWREETKAEQTAWAFGAGAVLSGGLTSGPTTALSYGGLDALQTSAIQGLAWGDGGSGHKNIVIGGLINFSRWQWIPTEGNPLFSDGHSSDSLALNAFTDTTFEASWHALRSGAVNLIEGRGTDSWRGALHGLYIGAAKQGTVNLVLGSRFRPPSDYVNLIASYGKDLGLEYGPLLKKVQFRRPHYDLGTSGRRQARVLGRSIFLGPKEAKRIIKSSDVLADFSKAKADESGGDFWDILVALQYKHGLLATCQTFDSIALGVHETSHIAQQYGVKTTEGDFIGYRGGSLRFFLDTISTYYNIDPRTRPQELFPYESEIIVWEGESPEESRFTPCFTSLF